MYIRSFGKSKEVLNVFVVWLPYIIKGRRGVLFFLTKFETQISTFIRKIVQTFRVVFN